MCFFQIQNIMLIFKYLLLRNGYLCEWYSILSKDLLRNYHLKCNSRIPRWTKTSFLELTDPSKERGGQLSAVGSEHYTTRGMFRWNQKLFTTSMGTEDRSTYISTCLWVINMDRQSSQWTFVELDDLSSYCFKLEARNLPTIRVNLEKIINWKKSQQFQPNPLEFASGFFPAE